ncbi:MAG: hypothetical protein IK115_12670, partial [Lachnospiraceae bacterium]|nr:hypothetical protein [Lachnospiraceae bacterium]
PQADPTPTLVPSGKSNGEEEEQPPSPGMEGDLLDAYDKTRPLSFKQTHEGNVYYDPERKDNTARATCNTMKLDDDDAESYPDLAAALEDYNAEFLDDVYGSGFAELKAQSIAANSDENQTVTVHFAVDYEHAVVRSDPTVTSIVTYSYGYAGGAHGSYAYTPVNFSSADGEILGIYDVLQTTENLPQILEKEILEKYDPAFTEEDGLAAIFEERIEEGKDFLFSLGYDNITFYFPVNDLGAPYAAGTQEVTLRFENYPGLVQRKYTQAADDYICQIPECGMLLPGSDDFIYTHCGNAGNELTFEVSLNGEEILKDGFSSYLLEPYLVHSNGNNYIFLDSAGYDCNLIFMYEFYNGEMKLYDNPLGYGLGNRLQGDVQNVRLYRMINYLTGYWAYRSCNIDRGGFLAYNNDYYMVDPVYEEQNLILKQNWEAEDPKGNTVRLREGDVLSLFRTDAETWVDLHTESGDVVRFYVEEDEDGQYIDGVNVEEIFDNIRFVDW